tara:strand:- start:337 stop:573 length:237 start_codon:yes stop_codon:yes gene_type:complete
MPNQPASGKKLIGWSAPQEIRDAIDNYARQNKMANRTEAMNSLISEALAARGFDIEKPKESFPEYLPDRLKKRKTAKD